MALYSRAGRASTAGRRLRARRLVLHAAVSGVALFVLALPHFSILHFLFDPAQQNSGFIDQRWSSIFWRTFDWLLLMMVLLHAFLGHAHRDDRTTLKGGRRTLALMGLYAPGHRALRHGHRSS